MKKYLVLVLTLTILACMFVSTTTVLANEMPAIETENTLPNTDEIVDKMTEGDLFSEEDKQLIKDLVAKVESYTKNSDSFFIKVIVPIMVAGVLVLVLGILLLLPIFRSKGETKTVKAMLGNAKKQIEDYKNQIDELKALVNTDTVKADLKAFFEKELRTLSVLLEKELDKENVELGKIEASLVALINGAINAWKASPEAVDKLTQVASSQELKNLSEENSKLKAYILQKGGENALNEVI